MPSEFEQNLEKYADVILQVGINLQPDQRLLIVGSPWDYSFGVPLELAPFVRVLMAKAYQLGARFVDAIWQDEEVPLLRMQHAPQDSFEEYPKWRATTARKYLESGDAVLMIIVWDADLLVGQDPELIKSFYQTTLNYYEPFLKLRHKKMSNCALVLAPIQGWANKVFPEIPLEKRIKKTWQTLFEICRVTQDNPVAAWDYHASQLEARSEYLNDKRYQFLTLTGPGTDLTIGLPEGHAWIGAGLTSQNGIKYIGNIPTEEICTVPHKYKTEGIVRGTKPLMGGTLIENFSLTFSQGRVIHASAKKGEEALLDLLKRDDCANYLGEVALVPHSSPISQTGVIFFNALIDENASCHLALGQGLRFCMEGGENMTDEEFTAAGGNVSGIHGDFMIGSGELNVDGIKNDGTKEPIMRNGEWAFSEQSKEIS